MPKKGKKASWLPWLLTLLAAVFLLEAAALWLHSLPRLHTAQEQTVSLPARVLEILDESEFQYQNGALAEQILVFSARLDGSGETVTATQYIDGNLQPSTATPVQPNDHVFLLKGLNPQEPDTFYFGGFQRISGLLILTLIFLAGILILGRLKGLHTVLSLILTCGAVFFVLIPSILAGQNIYLFSILTCAYIIGTSLLLLNGYRRKTFVAILGCLGGVLISALLTCLMQNILHMTGLVDEQSVMLLQMAEHINLRGILFGGILIGAVGAVMDVSMSVSAALHELSVQVEHPTFFRLFRSGLTIGQDMMGTMANTLILAYIGSSLTTVVLLTAFHNNLIHVLNSEMIVSELLQALAGSIGILVTIPLTALLAAALFSHKKNDSNQSKEYPQHDEM